MSLMDAMGGGRAPSVTVGRMTGNSMGTAAGVRVDGEDHVVANPTGLALAEGMSVTVLRLGQGRYQIMGLAGHWAPPA